MTHRTKMQKRGELILPVAAQDEARINDGDVLNISVPEPGVMMIRTLDVVRNRIGQDPQPIRWDLIDQIPDDMKIHGGDRSEGQWTWAEWREALGHPYADGHGFCRKCGAGGPCELAAFYDAVMMSVVRELDRMGALRPPV